MNRSDLSLKHSAARPLWHRPRRRLASFAGPALIFTGACSVLFALLAGVSQSGATGAMVGGAVGGAAIAEVTNHDAGRGAAIGALGGGLRAQMRERQQAQAMQQQATQQQAARARQKSVYDRAFGACMEARGYTVR